MTVLALILLVLAFAAFTVEAVVRRSLIAAGLACWVLIPLVTTFNSLT